MDSGNNPSRLPTASLRMINLSSKKLLTSIYKVSVMRPFHLYKFHNVWDGHVVYQISVFEIAVQLLLL